ncbi:hypothetical protein LCGC14_2706970 [marine sediment metagenome]|uniref:Uncharacterized protein n=1 Tax=marine sediment metagenome TaxID=412755 RepID=A0A0F9BN53_9ZZZZ
MAEKLKSILDVKLRCPECALVVKVGAAEPDIDGDGSLGCPRCFWVMRKLVVLREDDNG